PASACCPPPPRETASMCRECTFRAAQMSEKTGYRTKASGSRVSPTARERHRVTLDACRSWHTSGAALRGIARSECRVCAALAPSRRDDRRAGPGDDALESRAVMLQSERAKDRECLLELAGARRTRTRDRGQLGRPEGRDRESRARADRLGETHRPPVPALRLLGVPQPRGHVSQRRRDEHLAQPPAEWPLA